MSAMTQSGHGSGFSQIHSRQEMSPAHREPGKLVWEERQNPNIITSESQETFERIPLSQCRKASMVVVRHYSRSSSGRQMRRNWPTLSPSHVNISLPHKTHVAGRDSLEGPLVSITS